MRIVGVVKNSKNVVKIRDANIKLIVDSIELASVFSDENGGFEYRTDTDFTGKNLKLKIEKEGFESKSISFEIGSDVQDEEFEIKLTQKEEKTKVKIDKEAEIVKPEPSFDIGIGKDGINIGISSLSIPVKIAIGIIAIAFVVFLALPAIEEKSSLSITPDPLSFNIGDVNANETISRTFSISNPGKETLNWKVTADQSWVNIKPTSGVDSGTISIDINTAGLIPGSYAGIISIISNHGEKSGTIAFNIPQNPVPPQPQSPILNVSKKSLSLESTSVGDTKVVNLQISNTGSGTLDWQAEADKPWIELSKTSGTNEGSIIVTLNSAGLAPGKYIGTIIFASNGGTESVIIDFNVVAPMATTQAPTPTLPPTAPILKLSQTRYKIDISAGERIVKTFSISNIGGGILEWGLSTNENWIELNKMSGSDNGSIFITIDSTGLNPGNYIGTIMVTSNGGIGQVTVELNIISSTPTTPTPVPTTIPPTPPPTPVPTIITVSPATASVMVGGNQIFAAKTLDQFGNPISSTVTWSSSNQAVGSIDATGKFTAIAAGTTTITASSGLISGTATATVIPAPIIYFANALENPGSVYKLDNGIKTTFYTRISGNLYSFAFSPSGILFYLNANTFDLYDLVNGQEKLVYSHNTYVRDVEFDSKGNIYFSDATGAGGDGHIYLLYNGAATLFYTVKLSDVGGSWAGDFGFDDNDNLYLSSGNEIPASIYQVQNGVPKQVFYSKGDAIKGFSFDSNGNLYYTDFGQNIYQVDLSTGKSNLIYSNPSSSSWLSDVFIK